MAPLQSPHALGCSHAVRLSLFACTFLLPPVSIPQAVSRSLAAVPTLALMLLGLNKSPSPVEFMGEPMMTRGLYRVVVGVDPKLRAVLQHLCMPSAATSRCPNEARVTADGALNKLLDPWCARQHHRGDGSQLVVPHCRVTDAVSAGICPGEHV